MAHEYKLNKQSLRKIDLLLPRLKYSVLPSKIIRWLENFDDVEVDLAIDLLSVYEYIPFNEFMFRLNDLLFEIIKRIPSGEKIIIFPYGKVGKSGTLVTYPLKNTIAFQKKENDILLTHDIDFLKNLSDFKHIIFIDDFIGSGKTFIEEYKKLKRVENWKSNNKIENFYLLTTIIMLEGKKNIEHSFPEIKIHAEVRNKIFENGKSPLTAFRNILSLKTLATKYGKSLSPIAPIGFDNGQSLISFSHGTPDNTLPIIWVKTTKWESIFPRSPKIRMDEAREFKKGIAFYIGICNRLGIDLFTGKSIIEKIGDRYTRRIKNNTQYSHSIVALLFLKKQNYDNLIIAHLLGVTRDELKRIYLEAKMKGLIDINYELSINGYKFIEDLKSRTNKENFRKESDKNLEIKSTIYIPKKFNGLA